MQKKLVVIILFFIIILGSILRLWNLGSVPPSPDWDEVALGYNAYSILHTGQDEYGKFFPIVLRSYDDYKPALYSYLAIPSIQIFGLNVFAVRLPATIFGILTILVTFFLINELFSNVKLALLSSFLLAISPWHIQFSHTAFEASVGMSLNAFAALFFLKGFKKPWFLFLSVFCISLGIYVYQSEKVFAPLFFLTLIIIYSKRLFLLPRKYLYFGVIFGFLLTLPLIIFTLTNNDALARARGVSIFSESTSILKTDAQRLIEDRGHNDIIGTFFDNRRFIFAKEVIGNYLSHFDLNWLFITGDISRHHAPGMGLLYIWELPFLLIGIYKVLFGDYSKKTKLFLITWFLLVPIPASITTGVPHAVRTINFLPLFQIFSALGILTAFSFLSKSKNQFIRSTGVNFVSIIFILFFIFNFSYFLNQYYIQQNYFNSQDWQYGYAKIVPTVNQVQQKYKKIIVSNVPYMDQSYMFFLFYLQYPPTLYLKQSQMASGGFKENHSFGKYEFRPIQWDKEKKSSDILYIGRAGDFPTGVKKIFDVNFLNNSPAMSIVEG